MIADQQEKLDQNSGTAQRMFELSWILTAQSEDAVTEAVIRLRALLEAVGGIPGLLASEILDKFKKNLGASGKELSWHSLEQLSRRPNAVLWDFVGRNGGKKINFIAVDYFQMLGPSSCALKCASSSRVRRSGSEGADQVLGTLMKILIVDDSESCATIRAFVVACRRIVRGGDGVEAIVACREHRPDGY
jgi:hypothetical protein